MSHDIQLRTITDADHPFLYKHFGAVKMQHLMHAGLPEAQLQPLIEMQYRAQQASYLEQWPAAAQELILVSEKPAGQIRVARDKTAGFHLVDISLQPEFRRQGIASTLIQQLLQEAAANRTSVCLSVARENLPAIALYEKFGFQVIDGDELFLRMQSR